MPPKPDPHKPPSRFFRRDADRREAQLRLDEAQALLSNLTQQEQVDHARDLRRSRRDLNAWHLTDPTMCKIFDSTQLGSAVHSRALEAAHKRAETVRTLSDERLKAARTASQTATYVPPAVSAAPSSSVPPIDDPIMPYSQMKFESDAVRYDPNRPSTSRNDRRSQDAASYHGTPRQSSSGLAPPPSYVARRSQPQLGAGASSSSFVPGHRVKLSAVGVAPSVSSDGSRVSRGSRSSSALSVAQSSYSYAGDGYDSQSDSDSGQDASHSSTQQPRASSSKDKSKRRGDHPKCK